MSFARKQGVRAKIVIKVGRNVSDNGHTRNGFICVSVHCCRPKLEFLVLVKMGLITGSLPTLGIKFF